MQSDSESHSDETANSILARLQTLEEEIRRLTDLAAQEEDEKHRSRYWDLACDVRAEARRVRLVLAQMLPTRDGAQREPVLHRVLSALGLRMDVAATRF
jgi:type VI protein secretion system component VasK